MKQILLAFVAIFMFGAAAAHATCPASLELQDANNVKAPAKYTDDGAGNCQPNVVMGPFSHASVTSLGTSLVAKGSPGNLYGFNCTAITGGASGFCIAYNATTVPPTGSLTGANVLDSCFFDTTARGCALSRIPISAAYNSGIVVLISSATTPFAYTTGVNTGFISADYQ